MNSYFSNLVRIRTETDPNTIKNFTREEFEIWNKWRKKTMTAEEIREEEIKKANALTSLLL